MYNECKGVFTTMLFIAPKKFRKDLKKKKDPKPKNNK